MCKCNFILLMGLSVLTSPRTQRYYHFVPTEVFQERTEVISVLPWVRTHCLTNREERRKDSRTGQWNRTEQDRREGNRRVEQNIVFLCFSVPVGLVLAEHQVCRSLLPNPLRENLRLCWYIVNVFMAGLHQCLGRSHH